MNRLSHSIFHPETKWKTMFSNHTALQSFFCKPSVRSTANDRYSGDHYSGNNHYRGQIIQKKQPF